MVSYWHLAAACCIPQLNPTARQREREVFRQVAQDQAKFAANGAKNHLHGCGRWEAHAVVTVPKKTSRAK